ncbi:Decarboxylase tropJ-like protein [Elsinoe fawcettii]|nr:Decarboxylase tropJ-like protein [Elsinoe fawcettii]
MPDLASSLQKASAPIPSSFFSTLITANHILHSQSIVDGYGHVSSRSPQDPTIFYLSRSLAPALTSSRADILSYRVSDASPVPRPSSAPSSDPDPASPDQKHYLERHIHSEIYRRYPDVQAVVHAHSEPVIPFSITSVPLRPAFHMAGVMGGQVPVFDIEKHYQSSDKHDLLVTNQHLGTALAQGLSPDSWVSKAGGFIKNLALSQVGMGVKEEEVRYPSNSVVLMRGHGFTCVGTGVEEAVYRAIYTVVNARVQRDAVLLQGAYNTGIAAERIGKVGEKGYQEKDGGKVEGVKYLSEKESKEAWESNKGQIMRPWGLWVEEVKHSGRYKNEYWEKGAK